MSIADRGFASMPEAERKRIARLGGLASRGGGRPRKDKSQAKEHETREVSKS
jgi:hypothetical protein